MATPQKPDLLLLDFYQNGQPFCNVLAPSGGSGNLDYYQNAQPFDAIGTDSVDVTVNVTGVQGTTQLGTAVVVEDIQVSVTGLQATTYLGTATVAAAANIYVTGPPATAYQIGRAHV